MDTSHSTSGGNGHGALAASAVVRERLVRLGPADAPAEAARPAGTAYRQAVVLVGGQGTRLRPITCRVPKPVTPLLGRPFIAYVLENLARHGVEDVVLSCGHLAEAIEAQIGDGERFGLRVRYAVETSPLGTAGALLVARPLLGQGGFLVLNGDVLCDADLTGLLAFHRERGGDATLLVTPVEDARRYGLVELGGDGRVAAFLEKPGAEWAGPGLINAGAYVLEPRVLDLVPERGACSLERDVFPQLVVGGRLCGYVGAGYWRDIGTPESYLGAHLDLLRARPPLAAVDALAGAHDFVSAAAYVEEGAELTPPVHVDEGALVCAGARVGPSAVIGRFTRVCAGAQVRESVIQDHVVVGADAVVERSIVVRLARLGAACRLTDAVVGEGCRLGAHNVLANGVSLYPYVVLPDESVQFRELPVRAGVPPAD